MHVCVCVHVCVGMYFVYFMCMCVHMYAWMYTDVESDILSTPLSSSVLHFASQMLEPTEQPL